MVATSKLFASGIATVCVSKVSICLPCRPIVLVTFIICPCDFESSIIQDHRPLPRPDPATTADHTRNVAANNTLTRSDFGAAEPDRNLREIPPRRQSAGPMRRPVCRWMGQKSVAVHRAYVHVNQTTARAALAALDGLLGAHTTSVRQLDTGFTPSLQRMHR